MEYILIILCLIGSAFFSGTEIAYTSLSKLKMKQQEDSKYPSQYPAGTSWDDVYKDRGYK